MNSKSHPSSMDCENPRQLMRFLDASIHEVIKPEALLFVVLSYSLFLRLAFHADNNLQYQFPGTSCLCRCLVFVKFNHVVCINSAIGIVVDDAIVVVEATCQIEKKALPVKSDRKKR
jgi:multidrug efflux pump subunit AcrB